MLRSSRVDHLGILFEYFGGSEDQTGDQFRDGGRRGIDERLWQKWLVTAIIITALGETFEERSRRLVGGEESSCYGTTKFRTRVSDFTPRCNDSIISMICEMRKSDQGEAGERED